MEKYLGKIKHINDLLQSKQISCTELTNKYLDSIETVNSKLNAYVTVTDNIALETAKKVDEKIARGEKLMPLEGIPMTLKDNISTTDVETTCCSKILKGYMPVYDATVWKILKKQNAVLLGKTNMDEFAMGSSCETSYFGGSLNPHNHGYVAGGSSGGVASAVGSNLAVYGLGSDTGGSVRQPASFCGLVGLKPTYGSVSRFGLIAYASSFDQIGPITTSVEDSAIIYDAISSYDPKDATSLGNKGIVSENKLTTSIKGMKIGIAKEYFDGIRDDVRESIEKSIEVYEALGAEIVYFNLPQIKYAVPVYYILACAEASSNLGRYDGIRYGYKTPKYNDLNEMICKTRSEGFGKEVQRRIMLGTYVLSSGYYDAYYKKAQKLRGSIVKAFKEAFDICDIILTPTVPTTAFELNFTSKDPIETYLTDICTVPVNIAGLPAVSVPCGFDSKGLPIGMQLIGNRFEDAKLLNFAYQYEKQTKKSTYKEVEIGVRL
ncbi:aspartyl-tRNA(Asn)/glutamyl-tRNA(Gln) amidotransferase subunit A [Sedimentibacter acidaminivorans]|uniref:Glutamyl-tRNA(Gln) amidotransferase subunit A n=1 Tax=Sedimentibacter acidaminivorans TaxID=913099 RepID=A0ABS4GAG1_9FIRM|nr:Asp-tRNA(Asn)/Glu-tRNA(Gln) amidotransferase subunit GatA [Sedimentibacter acidaminivorans]MBP1924654.1 aspartyl-tRNA(Asn)/glutamyl-tRNA(Gln) amidotransferase subunit A [Sedimentibacter acidaminivorans]